MTKWPATGGWGSGRHPLMHPLCFSMIASALAPVMSGCPQPPQSGLRSSCSGWASGASLQQHPRRPHRLPVRLTGLRPQAGETMARMLKAVLWSALILVPAAAYAQGQPPIQSAQDAACRQEATRGVMSDSRGLDPYALGRQIWAQCMSRTSRVQRATRQVRRAKQVRRAHRHTRRVGRSRRVR